MPQFYHARSLTTKSKHRHPTAAGPHCDQRLARPNSPAARRLRAPDRQAFRVSLPLISLALPAPSFNRGMKPAASAEEAELLNRRRQRADAGRNP